MTNGENERTRRELGERFRKARESLHLTQQEVADRAGIHVNYYARIERGEENPSFDKLRDIKKALNIKSLGLI